MVLSMESISHGLRYMEKPSHHCSWGGREGTQAGVALLSLPLLGMSRSGTSGNLVCAYRNETGLCEPPPFLALLTQMQREGSTITHQEEGLTPRKPFLCLHLSVSHIWCQQHCSLLDIGPAGWQVRRIGTGREGRGGQADSSSGCPETVLALLRQKDIITQEGPSWRTATNPDLGSNVPRCEGNLGFLVI